MPQDSDNECDDNHDDKRSFKLFKNIRHTRYYFVQVKGALLSLNNVFTGRSPFCKAVMHQGRQRKRRLEACNHGCKQWRI